jgi:hypothetical protein
MAANDVSPLRFTKAVNANTTYGTGYNGYPVMILIYRWSNSGARRQNEAEQHLIGV